MLGDGPIDLVFVRPALNNLEIQWEEPHLAGYLTRLASFSRLMVFDARGSGLSDPFDRGAPPTIEDWADDIMAVMDSVGSERAAIVSAGPAAYRCITFAATHPELVTSLVVCDGRAGAFATPDYPQGMSQVENDRLVEWGHRAWGLAPQPGTHEDELPPGRLAWLNRYRRLSCPPGIAALIFASVGNWNVQQVLPVVSVPTLVIDHEHNVPHGRYIAEHIPNATHVELPGRVIHAWMYDDPDAVAGTIERFVTGTKGTADLDRVLATVLYTDIVDSTRRAGALGDKRWRDVLNAFDSLVASEVDRFRGRVIKSTGDGHLATFDAPGRAIRCAFALRDAVGRLDIELRAGLHTGEIELRGIDIGGMAVNIGRRVCDAAEGREVVVSG